ncbi:prolyl aminopeptidase [Polyplosphaeria fusca]|uniref:Proline iminopeptidase n=1 Tax=Polyplosphaeria fusca TaxID=682080 RepID=A0A9P4V7X2_9PLEO|nr:prolyl aminopeptidase [Polyplosphaeria fusca]
MAAEKGYTHGDAFDSGFLQVSDVHKVYYAQYGKPDGKPVICSHGGPGGEGTTKTFTTFFNPSVFRVVLIDQRGAGLSTPTAETRDNTTQLLVQDIETLRQHIGVQKWHMVFGGSWGSGLAVAYAQTHPDVCGSLVLRGIFMGSKWELDLGLKGTLAGYVYPEEFDRFVNFLPEEKRCDPLQSYHDLIFSDDEKVATEAATEWNRYGGYVGDKWNMSYAKINAHYFVNECFLGWDNVIKGCEKIVHIPTSIVQGRYDLLCLPRVAWDLHKALPQSKLYFSENTGHGAMEPENFKKLCEICDEYALQDFHLS